MNSAFPTRLSWLKLNAKVNCKRYKVSNIPMQKVFITGVAGFIGRCTARYFGSRAVSITGWFSSTYARVALSNRRHNSFEDRAKRYF